MSGSEYSSLITAKQCRVWPTCGGQVCKGDRSEDHERQRILLPVISNQKLNAYLKEIATVCKITKKLTFHLARHTFATTVTLANGVPIESVSRMLGHSSLKTTQIYAKVVDQKLLEDMKVVRSKYESGEARKKPFKKGEQLKLGFE